MDLQVSNRRYHVYRGMYVGVDQRAISLKHEDVEGLGRVVEG